MKEKVGISFNALDLTGACKRKKELANVRLTSDATLRMEQAGVMKAITLMALAARAVRSMDSVEALEELYQDCVLPEFNTGLTDKEQVEYSYLNRMMRSYHRAFGEFPDEISQLFDCDAPGRVRDLVKTAYKRLDWPTHQTSNVNARNDSIKISRYLAWEHRTAIFVEPKVVDVAGTDVRVAPDYVFDDGFGEYTVVVLNTGKPRLTQTGRTYGLASRSASSSLRMYSLWCYGMQNLASEGESVVACAISLTRADDTARELIPDFCTTAGARNIIVLAPDPKKDLSEFTDSFAELMAAYNKGVEFECNPKDCAYCELLPVCGYKKEPLKLDDEFVVKKAKDVVLSKAQNDVVYFRNGVARVNAGAGAGKTLVMSLFVTTLLDDGIDPADILCITYTKGGAEELGSRIAALVEDFEIDDVDPTEVMCTTFNGFGAAIIEKMYRELGFDQPPTIVDVERKKLIEELLDQVTIPGLDYGAFQAHPYSKAYGALDVVCAAFDAIKQRHAAIPTAEDLREDLAKFSSSITDDAAYEAMVNLYFVYEDQMKRHGYIEFADQEDLLWQLIARDPYFLEDILPFKYIVVDEFQDSSELQMELVKQFTYAKDFRALVCCGDDSQSIFRYRGAVPDNLIHFFEKMGVDDGVDLPLLENYRCREPIIEYANKINALNTNRVEKDLIATRGPGKPVVLEGFHSRKAEYDYIVHTVQEKLAEGYKPEDIAILAATGSELSSLAGQLNDAGVPSVLMCPEQCLENSKIAAAIGLRRALKSPGNTADIAAYLNAVAEGAATAWSADMLVDQIEAMASEIVNKYRPATPKEKKDLFNAWLTAIDPEQKDALFKDFKERIDAKHSLREKFEFIELFYRFGGQKMKRPGKYPGVVLSTVHSAKGLEWPVCIVSLSKFEPCPLGVEDTEEKRRLLFVAATRAREELILTGQYVAYKSKDPLAKRARCFHNGFLRESFEVLGKEYDPVDHEAEAEAEAKKAAKRSRSRKARV